MTEEIVLLKEAKLQQLMQTKLEKAGLTSEHAKEVGKHLTYADLRGVHSHGAVRVEYYAERIAKGGTTIEPNFEFEKTGSSTGVFHGDNAIGHVACRKALDYGIDMAKETGVAIIGVSKMGHSGMLSYYVDLAAQQDLVALAVCQSDPMAVPFGGTEPYYGTNPIAFSAPTNSARPIIFDMATTVQAWGKILDARSKNNPIPDTWAVDGNGEATTDPNKVQGLLPISGPKGYGLMMMVDILSGSLLGLPFGKHVSSMYADLSSGRNLGQLFILINPAYFTDLDQFKENLSTMIDELHESKPATGVEQVYYPGELSEIRYQKHLEEGIPVAKSIYDYLMSDQVHFNKYDHSDAFAEK
ncbi:ureidoglycolate dehydrogenase [Vagococcus carniphilus]|uniref:ureidoglycolate dehydrogenase n=1 Tax=Vagococcus carniphilus TaxID=218144 RepID=UPI00288F644E|nr:ureidoglycolate dehydrogenase [Vagococcus carniphilus]MDT2829396.1 ureidoglycolate dehydrogenase [Vagococcus carniphilus]MDT2838855.1 ureidoglycolate dehydrogenase [Vagococcus carniphilus]MDT2852913.1 ureidoglycolate dehydrogenase [Vagococcus carniphilus]